MGKQNIEKIIEDLAATVNVAFISSVDEDGFPNTKAMLAPFKQEGTKVFYWHTNSPSMRVKQYKSNSKACVYFCDTRAFKGIMLKGKMEVLDDEKIKKEFWKDEYEIYYKGGYNGGDFIILKFTAETARAYADFSSQSFELK